MNLSATLPLANAPIASGGGTIGTGWNYTQSSGVISHGIGNPGDDKYRPLFVLKKLKLSKNPLRWGQLTNDLPSHSAPPAERAGSPPVHSDNIGAQQKPAVAMTDTVITEDSSHDRVVTEDTEGDGESVIETEPAK